MARSIGDGAQRLGRADLAVGSEIRGLAPARRSFVMHLQRWSTPAGCRPSRVTARREGPVDTAELSRYLSLILDRFSGEMGGMIVVRLRGYLESEVDKQFSVSSTW